MAEMEDLNPPFEEMLEAISLDNSEPTCCDTSCGCSMPISKAQQQQWQELVAVKNENTALRTEIETKDRQLRNTTGSNSSVARVFAIPELLEQILLELEYHTIGPFRISSFANAKQLCRLERVNRHFHNTIIGSTKLLESRSLLNLSSTPTKYAAVAWLLSELGHTSFKIADCEAHVCYNAVGDWWHKWNQDALHVCRSPGYSSAVDRKKGFEEAIRGKSNKPWRRVKVPAPFKIIFKERSSAAIVEVTCDERTLGRLWDSHKNKL